MKNTSQKTVFQTFFTFAGPKMRLNANISIDINACTSQYYTPEKLWKSVNGCRKKFVKKITKIHPEKPYIFMHTMTNCSDAA